MAGSDGKKGTKRTLDPEEEAKRKKRMERFGIVDEKAEAAARAETEVGVFVVVVLLALLGRGYFWSVCRQYVRFFDCSINQSMFGVSCVF